MSQVRSSSLPSSLAQRLIERLSSMARYIVLTRQIGEVERHIGALDRDHREQFFDLLDRDLGRTGAKVPFTSARLSSDFASQTSAAMVRVRSENLHLRIRGLVLWVVTTWHETEQSRHDDFRELHRRLSKSMRLLRGTPQRVASAA